MTACRRASMVLFGNIKRKTSLPQGTKDPIAPEMRGERLLLALLTDGLEHRVGIGGLFQGVAEFGFVEELGDVGESMEMFLKLTLRHQEQHDQVHRLIVERRAVDVEPLISHVLPAAQVREAIGLCARGGDAMKVLLDLS